MNDWEQAEPIQVFRFSLWFAIAVITFFLAWAASTEIDQQVRGFGKIIPSGKIRTIQHLEGGIVKGIPVAEGQLVKEGDVLLHLSNKRAEAEMKEIEVELDAFRIRQVRLLAEKEERGLVFPPELVAGNKKIEEAERSLFTARRSELNEKINGLQSRMNQKVLKLDDLETTVENLQRELNVAKEQLAIKTQLMRSGAISRSQYLEAESEVKNFDTRISKIRKEIPITKSELSEIINLLEETRQGWQSEVVEELNDVNIAIKKLEERIKTFSDAVKRTEVRSSVTGVVNKLYVNTIGGVLQPGQTIADIIPVEETLVVDGRISTEDRGKIWVGLPAVAKITAYDYSIYGGIAGELTYVSADSFLDNQNRQYYQVRIELEKTKISDDKPVFPGMTVEINILASKITILDAVLRPFRQIRENALREL
ncbi:MAG: HlyD family type I secretion periplasmic adaptor subunit [Verrucomicrobiae bacterium]|nr:HlyD family type I secretion periplasmic adaptor subunit [Verrucomicrobiae bacterium]